MKSKMDGSVVIFLGLWWPTSSSRARSSMIVIWVRVECPGMNWWVMSLCCRGYMWTDSPYLVSVLTNEGKAYSENDLWFHLWIPSCIFGKHQYQWCSINFFFTFDTRNDIQISKHDFLTLMLVQSWWYRSAYTHGWPIPKEWVFIIFIFIFNKLDV